MVEMQSENTVNKIDMMSNQPTFKIFRKCIMKSTEIGNKTAKNTNIRTSVLSMILTATDQKSQKNKKM